MELPPFQALLDSYGRDVHRFLVANVGATDADDCYQETWIAALRGYPRLQQSTNLRGWLLTIASRKAIDCVRTRRRAPLPVGRRARGAGAGRARHRRRSGWAARADAPPKQRTAVALRYALDAEYSAVADAMGTSEDAARRNVHEGLKRLRREYDDDRL